MEVRKLLKQVTEQPQDHTKELEAFKECYEGLQIGPYSDDVLQDVIENDTNNVSAKFKAIASEQLDKSGITSPLLKANLLKGCDEVLHQFELSISGLYDSVVAYNKKQEFDRVTKTPMKISFMGILDKCYRVENDRYKLLEIGTGTGLITECNKSIDFSHSRVRIESNGKDWFIYAKWPRIGGNATLHAFNEVQPNTDKDFYILWQTGTFNQIKF